MTLVAYLRAERGRVNGLAAKLEVSGSLITQWAGGKPVPAARAVQIERATHGVVTRRDLRPDDWHQIWPELVSAQHPVPQKTARAA